MKLLVLPLAAFAVVETNAFSMIEIPTLVTAAVHVVSPAALTFNGISSLVTSTADVAVNDFSSFVTAAVDSATIVDVAASTALAEFSSILTATATDASMASQAFNADVASFVIAAADVASASTSIAVDTALSTSAVFSDASSSMITATADVAVTGTTSIVTAFADSASYLSNPDIFLPAGVYASAAMSSIADDAMAREEETLAKVESQPTSNADQPLNNLLFEEEEDEFVAEVVMIETKEEHRPLLNLKKEKKVVHRIRNIGKRAKDKFRKLRTLVMDLNNPVRKILEASLKEKIEANESGIYLGY